MSKRAFANRFSKFDVSNLKCETPAPGTDYPKRPDDESAPDFSILKFPFRDLGWLVVFIPTFHFIHIDLGPEHWQEIFLLPHQPPITFRNLCIGFAFEERLFVSDCVGYQPGIDLPEHVCGFVVECHVQIHPTLRRIVIEAGGSPGAAQGLAKPQVDLDGLILATD
jgi:hypothetical protein